MSASSRIALPTANLALSRGYRRINAHLAETVAALPPFVCDGLQVRVPFCHVLRAPRGHDQRLHRQGYLELTFITEGCVHYATANEEIPVSVGQVFLMPPGVPHRWEIRDKPGVLFGFMLEMPAPENLASLSDLEEAVRGTHYCLTVDPQVVAAQALLSAQVAERRFRAELAAPLMQALLTMTFHQLLGDRRDAEAQGDAPGRQRALFEKARTYIDANIEHALNLDEVADFIGISTRQLTRVFRALDGRSATTYAHERRLERALALLAEGHSAKETAYACGFRDPAYFTRFFKRYTGRTPSEYALAITTPVNQSGRGHTV